MVSNSKGHPNAVARVGPLVHLPALLSEYGFDAESVFAEFGFQSANFENPDYYVPYFRGSLLIERCVDLMGLEGLGLTLGIRTNPDVLGLGGYMLRMAPDIRTALEALLSHFDLHDEGGVPSLVVKGKFSYLGFHIIVPEAHAKAQLIDMAIAVACKILRNFGGLDWNPTQVLLARPEPENTKPYLDYYKTVVQFDADRSAVMFPSELLDNELANSVPLLFQYLDSRAIKLREENNGDLISMLRKHIRRALFMQEQSVDSAAEYLGMNKRTLNRLLCELDTSYREELKNVRFSLAKSYLANSMARSLEIAMALGYKDVTSFNRSFKRWSGLPPEKWRSTNRLIVTK